MSTKLPDCPSLPREIHPWIPRAEDCGIPGLCGDADIPEPGIAPGGRFFTECGVILRTLSVYGAAGIASFGWVLSRLLHFECGRYVPLWFCSALFIYNLDRLKTDPADAVNTPARSQSAASLRKVSLVLAVVSAAVIVAVPVLEHDWLMLLLTTCGAVVCANYSVSMLGFRFKDVPFLKSFFAPTLVTAAFVAPPLLQQSRHDSLACYAILTLWTWSVTLFNMILCDLRDIEGDARTGIRSVPVAMGRRGTFFTLGSLLALGVALSIAVLSECQPDGTVPWILIAAIMPLYLAGLMIVIRKPMPEDFYEWWVEGILLVPAVAYCSAEFLKNT